MSKKMIVANWKENPKNEAAALRLAKAVAKGKYKADVVICPPFVYLESLSAIVRRQSSVKLGAQDVFWEEAGPYTSEVGPKMLRSLGVRYVILGHSERRKWLHETDMMINRKIKLALKDGLTVILCVGEPAVVRKERFGAAKRYVASQLKKDLRNVSRASGLIVAYEPIWAIGTGKADTPQEAREMITFIKKTLVVNHKLKARVLYGGSVNSGNIGNFIQYKEIDGALVGGASLGAKEFNKIIKAVE